MIIWRKVGAEGIVIKSNDLPPAPKVRYTTSRGGEWHESDPIIDDNGVFSGFDGKETAVEVVLPENAGIEEIGDNVFQEHENLVSVVLPSGVTSIGEEAFGNCSNLETVSLPNTLTSIGGGAFDCCGALTDI